MQGVPSLRVLLPVLLALLMLAGSSPMTSAPSRGALPAPHSGTTSAAAVPAAASTLASSLCLPALAHFESLTPPDRAPAVNAFGQSPCVLGPDESVLSLLSNQSDSASRAQVALTLPPAGGGIGSTLTGLSVRLGVSGVPCSVDGASLLDLQLQPPLNPFDSTPTVNWSVRGPVYDLVPPASCDPTCTNDSALITWAGLPYCENLALRPSAGIDPAAWTGGLSPGDHLIFTFLGTVGGSAPLTVLLNDSEHPFADRSFVYSSDRTVSGRPLQPWSTSASLPVATWLNSAGLAFAATLCPSPGYDVSTCLSYNRTLEDAVGPLRITSAASWNATTGSYSNAYEGVAVASATRSCQSPSIPCSGFAGPMGGFYPYWSLHGGSGQTDWEFGGTYPGELRSFAEEANAAPRAAPPAQTPVAVTDLQPSVTGAGATDLNLSLRVSDPAGVSSVRLIARSPAPPCPRVTLSTYSLTASATAGNSSSDGAWSVYLSGQAQQPGGILPGLLQVRTIDGRTLPDLPLSIPVTNLSTCALAAPTVPTFTSADVTPVAGGYALRWNETDPTVLGYTVSLRPPVGPPILVSAGNVTSTRVDLASYGVSYSVAIAAVGLGNLTSSPTSEIAAAPTLGAFALVLGLPPAPLWFVASNASFSSTLAGGTGPYNLTVDFGDGTFLVAPNVSMTFSFHHDYGLFFGNALVSATATDALGDIASVGPLPLPIWATPLGVPQSLAAGDSAVNLSFALPASPSDPVTGYTVLWTTSNANLWELGSAVYSNDTFPGVVVWNTTNTYLRWSVPNGVPVYAEVRASDFYGMGALPAGYQVETATAAPLTISPIFGLPGGSAPFSDNLSAVVSGGSGDALTTALYSFPPGVSVAATVTAVNGSFFVNATVTFPSPGTFVVVLHVVDVFFDIVIATSPIVVANGAPPMLAIDLLNAPAYAGSPLHFQATASGGSGSYGYFWAFGDGASSPIASPSHTYAVSGSYTVVLTALDLVTGGENITELPVTVYSVPVLYLSVSQGPNGSLSYDFRASVGGGSGNSTVVWTFGDASVARGTVVSHDFKVAGTYRINVSATDPAGRSGTTSFNLTVHPAQPSTGGGGGSAGLTSLDTLLIVIVVGLAAITLLLIRQRPPPPEEEPERVPFADGEVSLT